VKAIATEKNKRIGVPVPGRLPIDPETARLCDAGRVEDSTAKGRWVKGPLDRGGSR
jgi:hypothetical protein